MGSPSELFGDSPATKLARDGFMENARKKDEKRGFGGAPFSGNLPCSTPSLFNFICDVEHAKCMGIIDTELMSLSGWILSGCNGHARKACKLVVRIMFI